MNLALHSCYPPPPNGIQVFLHAIGVKGHSLCCDYDKPPFHHLGMVWIIDVICTPWTLALCALIWTDKCLESYLAGTPFICFHFVVAYTLIFPLLFLFFNYLALPMDMGPYPNPNDFESEIDKTLNTSLVENLGSDAAHLDHLFACKITLSNLLGR